MKRKVIGIVAAIALASVGTLALVGYVQSAKDEAAAASAPVEVYVLSKDVPAHTPIEEIEKSLKVLSVPKDVTVEGAVRDLDQLDEELVAAVDLRAGEQLLASRLVDRAEAAQSDVPKGLQEVTVALDPERAVGGDLKVGDTVGVVLSYDPFDTNVVRFDPANPFSVQVPGTQPTPDAPADGEQTDATTATDESESSKTPNMTHLTFHKVLVTGVQFNQNDTDAAESGQAAARADEKTADGEPVEQAPSGALLVTLALSSPEVEQVVFAAEFGHIWLTAENADADESGTRIVDLGEAYGDGGGAMTNQALTMEGWAPPASSASSPGVATTVAVLGEDRILAEQATDAMGPDDRLHVQAWRHGDDHLDATRIVADLAAADVGVVCAAADVPLPISFAVASIVDRDHPEMSVILIASPDGDVWRDALRAGVRDVIEPGRIDLELPDAVERAKARAAHVREQRAAPTATEAPTTGKVIVVLSPKGGSGKTMVTSNLAAALAQTQGASVALVDLDVQFGDSATALGLTPERSIGQLATMPSIDSTTLKVFLTSHEASGAFVLCGSDSPEEGDAVTAEHADRILELLTADFQYVIVDTPAGLDERTLTVLERATDVICVTSTDVSSIRSMAKELGILGRLGLLSAERHFVLNRADARVGIEIADVEAALGMTTDAAIPSSRAVPLSMNQGRPIVIDSPSSPAARELLRLAARIEGRDNDGRKVRLPWRRK